MLYTGDAPRLLGSPWRICCRRPLLAEGVRVVFEVGEASEALELERLDELLRFLV